MGRIVEVDVAIDEIPDNSVIAVSGFNLLVASEYLLLKLFEHYKETGHPKNIFLEVNPIPTAPTGVLDRIMKELYNDLDQDFLSGILVTYPGWSPYLQKLIQENRKDTHGQLEQLCGFPGRLQEASLEL